MGGKHPNAKVQRRRSRIHSRKLVQAASARRSGASTWEALPDHLFICPLCSPIWHQWMRDDLAAGQHDDAMMMTDVKSPQSPRTHRQI